MKKLTKNGRIIRADDGSVSYEINNAGPGSYSVVKFTGHDAKTLDSGTYLARDFKGMAAAIAGIEEDAGGKITGKVKQTRRSSAQKRRDNFVMYD